MAQNGPIRTGIWGQRNGVQRCRCGAVIPIAYRKALRADCTCNGHNPAGLAPVDLALDDSLRPGDVLAATDGLVAYSGIRVGNDQTPDFTS